MVERWTAAPGSRLARLRIELHKKLDAPWEFGFGTRSGAYDRLARLMGMKREDCHIGMFDEAQCERAMRLLNVADGA